MSLRGAIKFAIPISVTIVGWFLAPIIKAEVDGTELKGLPGILAFWKKCGDSTDAVVGGLVSFR